MWLLPKKQLKRIQIKNKQQALPGLRTQNKRLSISCTLMVNQHQVCCCSAFKHLCSKCLSFKSKWIYVEFTLSAGRRFCAGTWCGNTTQLFNWFSALFCHTGKHKCETHSVQKTAGEFTLGSLPCCCCLFFLLSLFSELQICLFFQFWIKNIGFSQRKFTCLWFVCCLFVILLKKRIK